MVIGFDNDKYINLQSNEIKKRINKFGNKLYMEFGGKLFNDFHASRVLPGFKHDSKLKMLLKIKEDIEMLLVISAQDIKNRKLRSDINITYEEDIFRLIKKFRKYELEIHNVIITQFETSPEVTTFIHKLEKLNIKVIKQYRIKNYPQDVDLIVSEQGFGKNEYAITRKNLIVVTAPGPGSGKLSAILSQLYHDNKNQIKSGYAKFETFPIWNLPINHPVNLAYEAATVDLNDVNMIDEFHLKAYKIKATNYNRDLEAFPILNKLLNTIYKSSLYKSPTDMGVNMAGFCITDDNVVSIAAKKEIIRRYYQTIVNYQQDKTPKSYVNRLSRIIKNNNINSNIVKSIRAANEFSFKNNKICSAIEINAEKIIIGKESNLLNSNSATILNALKYFANIEQNIDVLDPEAISLAQDLKRELHYNDLSLDLKETLFALSISAKTSSIAKKAFDQINKLSGLYLHRTTISSESDKETLKSMDIHLTEQTTNIK
ncbi:DUF1846 domain-containing protein [Mycoplasmopsis arginini]|uniref:DUF1846 domain-containing protein n=1 Tax=Mycoplasmopsis arginini TaxID=2094 RepID=A0ABZ2AP43_MYCAR|nr:DUF1846 domain-containing protein [Mycoplasmopsis arginini]WVN21936.1 DUF1846 domain-containing protein [Mycoplasmopsis arginini]VEU81948.1 Uncharacterized protein conserved in bacteria [Mycoplasmopsis arginini]